MAGVRKSVDEATLENMVAEMKTIPEKIHNGNREIYMGNTIPSQRGQIFTTQQRNTPIQSNSNISRYIPKYTDITLINRQSQ